MLFSRRAGSQYVFEQVTIHRLMGISYVGNLSKCCKCGHLLLLSGNGCYLEAQTAAARVLGHRARGSRLGRKVPGNGETDATMCCRSNVFACLSFVFHRYQMGYLDRSERMDIESE